MSGEDVITVRGLFKDRVSNFLRKRIRVLDNLDLTVRRGETYGLLGPNGAGKTTTIKILLGLLRPDRGEINLLGAKPGDHTILKKIGFLPENPYFYSYLTAHEFLDFASQLFGLDRGKSKEHNLELLKRVGLAEEWADRPMHQYSKGMLQRLGIAQSLVNDPEILFLDEPMSGLDPIGRKDVREILSTLKEEGKTIFFNSHLLPDVNEICDRIGIMHQGRLVAEESIANISRGESYKALEDFFLAKVEGKKEGSTAAMTELKATLAIALNTFRESVRDRVLYAFFIFACLITMLGIVLGSLSIGQEIRIIEDLGLSVIAIIGGIITVFTGTTLVYKELDKRTIYVIFSKPVTSWQFVLGKYLGLAACIILVTAAMGLFLVALIWMVDPLHQIQLHLPWLSGALGLVLLELLFVLAIATFFSTFSTPIMSVIFTLSIWFIGHLGSSLLELSNMSQNQMAKMILSGIYWILPDLAGLTRIRLELTYMQPPSQEILSYLVSYIVAYVVLLLGAAAVVNERREFP